MKIQAAAAANLSPNQLEIAADVNAIIIAGLSVMRIGFLFPKLCISTVGLVRLAPAEART